MEKKNIGAFFDIDGTLSRDSMLIHHFRRLVKYDIIDESEWLNRIRPFYRRYDKRYAEYDDYLDQVTDVYKKHLEGMDRTTIDFTAEQVVEEFGDVVYRVTRERVKWHINRGHLVFFVSGSPDFLVSKLAKKYGVTDFRATTYVTDEEGKFTSTILPMWDSASKAVVVKELEEEYNLDLEKSYAYGDTNGDYSMLQMMGHAAAINPSYRLLTMIQKDPELSQKVSIIIERKDVIYRLTSDVHAGHTLAFNRLRIEELENASEHPDDDWEFK